MDAICGGSNLPVRTGGRRGQVRLFRSAILVAEAGAVRSAWCARLKPRLGGLRSSGRARPVHRLMPSREFTREHNAGGRPRAEACGECRRYLRSMPRLRERQGLVRECAAEAAARRPPLKRTRAAGSPADAEPRVHSRLTRADARRGRVPDRRPAPRRARFWIIGRRRVRRGSKPRLGQPLQAAAHQNGTVGDEAVRAGRGWLGRLSHASAIVCPRRLDHARPQIAH
jgi:hypothetical protein